MPSQQEAPNCHAHLVCIPPSRPPLLNLYIPALCRGSCALEHRHSSSLAALPQGPSFRSGLCCPGPSSLNRPHAPHSQAHLDFAAWRLIRDAIAVPIRNRPRQPATGSELSLMLFHNMSSSETTGNFSAAPTQYFTENSGLQLGITVSAFPSSSHSDSSEVCVFEA